MTDETQVHQVVSASAETVGAAPPKPSLLDRLPWRRRARERQRVLDRLDDIERRQGMIVRALQGHTAAVTQHANGWIDLCARVGALELVVSHSGGKKRQVLQTSYKRILAELQARAIEGQTNPEAVRAAIAAHMAQQDGTGETEAESVEAGGES